MTNAEARFNKIHIRKVYACLAVTCHLHFWQNDRDFLRATVVTRGWNGYRNKSQHRKSTLEKKILPPFQQGFELEAQTVNVRLYTCTASHKLVNLSVCCSVTRTGPEVLQQGDSQVSEPCHDKPVNGVAQRAGGWQTGTPLFRSARNRNFL